MAAACSLLPLTASKSALECANLTNLCHRVYISETRESREIDCVTLTPLRSAPQRQDADGVCAPSKALLPPNALPVKHLTGLTCDSTKRKSSGLIANPLMTL